MKKTGSFILACAVLFLFSSATVFATEDLPKAADAAVKRRLLQKMLLPSLMTRRLLPVIPPLQKAKVPVIPPAQKAKAPVILPVTALLHPVLRILTVLPSTPGSVKRST